MFSLDGYMACDGCKDWVDDGSFVKDEKYLCHDCLDKKMLNATLCMFVESAKNYLKMKRIHVNPV